MTPIERLSQLRIDSTVWESIKLRPGQKITARVIESYGEYALVRTMGRLVRMRTDTPLQRGLQMTLQVQNALSTQGERILKLIDAAPAKEQEVLTKLDIAALLALATQDERIKKRIKKELDPKTLAAAIDTKGAKIGKVLHQILQKPKIQKMLFEEVKQGFEKETIEALLDHQKVLQRVQEFKSELGELYEVLEEGLQSFWLAALISGLFVVSLPLAMENLEENSVAFKALRDCYFCRIYLRFSDIGEVVATLLLRRNLLEIFFSIEDEGFRKKIEESQKALIALFHKPTFVHISSTVSPSTDRLLADSLQDIKI